MLRRSRPFRSVAAVAATLLLAACASDAGEDVPSGAAEGADPLVVVATTSILGDIVEQLLGDQGDVTVLMGPGVDPHGYQPSARDGALLREADLVVANGLQLEESLVSALEAATEDGVEVFELAAGLDPIEFSFEGEHDHGHGHDEDDGHGHDDGDDHGHDHDEGDAHDEGDDHGHDEDDGHDHAHGPEDPHIWFDPVRMLDGVQQLSDALVAAGDLDVEAVESRTAAYLGELEAVHAELEDAFAPTGDGDRVVVTNHDALGYLAHRYDFEVLGTVVPGSSTQVETDAQQFAELIATVEDAGVTTIFAENTDSTVLAEQLASEVIDRGDLEVEVVRIATDALDEPGSDADTYLGLLRATGTTVAASLAD